MIYCFENMSFEFAIKYFEKYPQTYNIWRTSTCYLSFYDQASEKDMKNIYYNDILIK